jgi:histidinol dehydrogenase
MSFDTVTWTELSAAEQRALLQRPAASSDALVRKRVEKIINKVRESGDAALKELTRQLDGVDLDKFRVSDDEFEQAEGDLATASTDAIELAISNVRRFHEKQVPVPIDMQPMPGVRCERVSRPIDSVGLYVPAGSAPLPSAAIMLAVPAAIAACPLRIMCTPPRPDGKADPAVLVAAKRCGVHTVFKIGGAQAIAAMAYGTVAVPKVDKIFGPGNAWVTTAKSLVSSDALGAAIDMPAGPSEVLVIADETADADVVATDLLSQAEHGEDSQVILVTTSRQFGQEVGRHVAGQLAGLGRREIAEKALSNSRSILVPDLATALEVSNAYAPEHLIIQTSDPRDALESVRNAGSVFLGRWSPESAGDYCSGTNHVLPTNGFARSYSGLGVEQYMRQMTVQELSEQGLRSIAPAIMELADLEGLDAHADAVRRRLNADTDAESAA